MSGLIKGLTVSIPALLTYEACRCYGWKSTELEKRYQQIEMSRAAHDFAAQAGVTKEVKFFLAPNLGDTPAACYGNNSIADSDVAVLLNPKFLPQDDSSTQLNDAMNVAMRHEYVHLTKNDMFVRAALRVTVSVVSALFGLVAMKPSSALLMTVTATVTSHIHYSMFMEHRSDEVAIKESSRRELSAALSLLKQHKEAAIQARSKSLWARILFSPEGNRRGDIIHPSLSSRIKMIELALR